MTDKRYTGVKISEEAKVTAEAIRDNYRPDMEMQELYSAAILGFMQAYYPDLEEQIQETMRRRQAARRGDGAGPLP